jgi:hypothetical protein
MGLGGYYIYAKSQGCLTPSSVIANSLGLPIYSVSKVGDIVADPEGFTKSCYGLFKCPTGNWISTSVHTNVYKNDSVLQSNIASTFAKLVK